MEQNEIDQKLAEIAKEEGINIPQNALGKEITNNTAILEQKVLKILRKAYEKGYCKAKSQCTICQAIDKQADAKDIQINLIQKLQCTKYNTERIKPCKNTSSYT